MRYSKNEGISYNTTIASIQRPKLNLTPIKCPTRGLHTLSNSNAPLDPYFVTGFVMLCSFGLQLTKRKDQRVG
jgi:hypothetical protein